jgi:antitoxin ParD1/3/4
MSIELTPQTEALIRQKVASGRYASADEAIATAVRLLDEHDRRMDWLRSKMASAAEQVKHGDVVELTDAFLAELDREVDERLRRGDTPSPDVCP